MKWTTTIPTCEGQYWWRANEESHENFKLLHAEGRAPLLVVHPKAPPVVLRVGLREGMTKLTVTFSSGTFTVKAMAGEWAGPLPLPEEN